MSRPVVLDVDAPVRPRVAVWKFSSCDGCQLSLLDRERDLLTVADLVTIASFPEVSSDLQEGPYDLSLVEGSVSTPEEVDRIQRVREQSTVLVAIGACATSGGIQALRNVAHEENWTAVVYPRPEMIDALNTATPISDHVDVDLELPGCPIDGGELVEVLLAYVQRRAPRLGIGTVCAECKARRMACVMVAAGTPCLGPVTRSGCGALCPAFDRGCYGCFGPAEGANTESLDRWFSMQDESDGDRERRWRGVSGWSPAFRRVADRIAADRGAETPVQVRGETSS